jgi:ribonucleoside-diphosphate reductase alpha chain
MITLKDNQPQIEEILPEPAPLPPLAAASASRVAAPAAAAALATPAAPLPAPAAPVAPAPAQGVLALHGDEILERPDVVEARVYRLRSGFVRHNVYITLGWIEQAGARRPIEIFFNSKDLTRSPEYAILTRLISALFRMSADPAVILEELRGIHDPAGGHFKNGRYMHSFYAEVADVIERFFYDVGILTPTVGDYAGASGTVPVLFAADPGPGATVSLEASTPFPGEIDFPGAAAGPVPPAPSAAQAAAAQAINAQFKICPECNQKALKLENGCDVCVACGYSKCDK